MTVGANGSMQSSALHGVRVVDFGQYLAGPLAAMVLGDLGADVVRVDPPGGPRWRHVANAALQRGKGSIVLDLKQSDDVVIARRLIARADVVIENFRPGVMRRLGLGPEESLAGNGRLIYCSLPGFAEDDPRAQLQAWEGVVQAATGLHLYPGCSPSNFVGDRTRDPFVSAIPGPSTFAAIVALHSILAALVARERGGFGQRVEVPLYDATFELLGPSGATFENPPPPPAVRIGGGRGRPPQIGYYRCADGNWLELCLFQDKHLEWFAEVFMPQEWIDDGMADARRMHTEPELQQRARARLAELLATRTAREWEVAINEESGAPSTICQPAWEWLREDAHARDNCQVIELDDPELGRTQQIGYPFRMSRTPPQAPGPRHALGADRERILAELDAPPPPAPPAPEPGLRLPLEGMRVVDVAQVLAGPTASRILAEYGADVVKIHSFEDRQLGWHLHTNSGKRSVMLNLKTDEGRQIFAQLAAGADVFVENFTRGVAERLGVGEADLRALSPDVVYVQVSAFGHDGYRGGWRGREQLGQSVTGMESRLGGYDAMPLMAAFPYCDYGSGNLAAAATLAAIFVRLRDGEPQQVHGSLAHTGSFLQVPYMVAFDGRVWDEPNGLDIKGWSREDRLYKASDDWFYVAGDLDRLSELAGRSEAELEERFGTEPCAVWVKRLVAAGVAAHRRLDVADVMDDPRAQARGLSVWRRHDGVGRVRSAGPSPRLSRTPPRLTAPARPPGSDTRMVLEELGYDGEVDALVARGVVQEGLPEGTTFVGMFR